MPAALRPSREYWSVPALIDWMNLSFGARPIRLLRHNPEIDSTSASAMRTVSSSIERTSKCRMPVWRSAKRSAMR
jgi:hypothetical protein